MDNMAREQPRVIGLFAISLALVGGNIAAKIFSPVQEMAKLDLGISDFEVSLVQGLAAAIPIALLSIPIGRLADRITRMRILIAMSMVWTIGTILASLAQSFAVLFIARMLANVAAIALPVAISLAADFSSPARRGRAILVLSLGVSAGGAAAFAFGGWLSGVLIRAEWSWLDPSKIQPWRSVQLLAGLICFTFILPLLWIREPARMEVGSLPGANLLPVLRELWNRRSILLPLFIGQISVIMADTAATIWASPVLIRDHGLRPDEFGGWMGLVVLIPGIGGAFAGGFLADFGQRLKIRGGILFGSVLAAALSIPAATFALMPSVEGFAALLALLLFCGAIAGVVNATAIAVLVPNELRGICVGALIVLSAIVAIGIAPSMVTVLAGVLGGDSYLAPALGVIGTAVSAASLVAFLVAMARMPRLR
jgi:MFS family permease